MMHKIAFIACISALFLSASAAFAQKPAEGPLVFQSLSWDFGEIEEAAGPVSHTFTYFNDSDAPMLPEYVRPSCSCTTALYEHASVAPGQVGEITVTYDPASLPGQFHQYVELVTNHGKSRYRLHIDGVVKERTKEVDELFPYFVSDGLQVSVLNVKLGFAEQGVRMEKTVGIVNTGKASRRLAYSLQKPQTGVSVSGPQELKAGANGLISIVSDIPAGTYGTIDNRIMITADGKPAVKNLSLSGFAVEKRVDDPKAPSFRYTPSLINLGQRKSGSTAKSKVTLSNTGGKPLHIRKVECPAGVSCSLREGQVIQAGAAMDIQVEVTIPAGNGNIRGSVKVFTDDPARPMREILYTTLIK